MSRRLTELLEEASPTALSPPRRRRPVLSNQNVCGVILRRAISLDDWNRGSDAVRERRVLCPPVAMVKTAPLRFAGGSR